MIISKSLSPQQNLSPASNIYGMVGKTHKLWGLKDMSENLSSNAYSCVTLAKFLTSLCFCVYSSNMKVIPSTSGGVGQMRRHRQQPQWMAVPFPSLLSSTLP